MNGWAIFFIIILVFVIAISICVILNMDTNPPPPPPTRLVTPRVIPAPTPINEAGITFLPLQLEGSALVVRCTDCRSATTIGGKVIKLSKDGFKIKHGSKKYALSAEFDKIIFLGSLYGLSCGTIYKITLGGKHSTNTSVEEVRNLNLIEKVVNMHRFGEHLVVEMISRVNVYSFERNSMSNLCMISTFKNTIFDVIGYINGYLFIKSHKGYFLISNERVHQVNRLPTGIKSTTSLNLSTGLNSTNVLYFTSEKILESDANIIVISR
jgi:hypothetical protein